MRRDCDAASSVVIGFVILLMLVALGIGIWALISVPDMVKEAESTHAIELSNTFLDLKLSADKVRVNNFEGARFSMLMPGSSGMSGTTIGFANTTGSILSIYIGSNTVHDAQWKDIGRLSAQVGGTRGSTVIGYEGGGVFRSDNGNAVWLTPGLIEVYPQKIDGNSTIRVDMVMPVLSGNAAISSNWGAPVDVVYTGKKDRIVGPTNETLVISFSTSDDEQRNLWYSLFYEAETRFNAKIGTEIGTEWVGIGTVKASVEDTAARLTIEPGVGGPNDMKLVKVYIREATYDVSLVNRYEES
ncbi:hypothetical protein [Methanocorpusculum vombati]|uniref:Type IV pilin n=1 Tax=Methanocorpusculum vombati TaxID=3002864 RepID=A0ABT4IPR0_9EURY|nr:hypothetical protein [Methanocorpusculum vombati]MCZ9319870.1 hypothetical protein [Methanocorpusculum sp.]MCZ0863536.1 hypothetical protein [Methanocorpusculum vombati]MDE2521514.1 hypothetical protein [Methanocorpusculum sp.]MDE2547042.1 hypothetical protein [Methanocorpusculum sp.]MDE2548347.1 hypothetical protein [Methanocorpusculum sp.]